MQLRPASHGGNALAPARDAGISAAQHVAAVAAHAVGNILQRGIIVDAVRKRQRIERAGRIRRRAAQPRAHGYALDDLDIRPARTKPIRKGAGGNIRVVFIFGYAFGALPAHVHGHAPVVARTDADFVENIHGGNDAVYQMIAAPRARYVQTEIYFCIRPYRNAVHTDIISYIRRLYNDFAAKIAPVRRSGGRARPVPSIFCDISAPVRRPTADI